MKACLRQGTRGPMLRPLPVCFWVGKVGGFRDIVKSCGRDSWKSLRRRPPRRLARARRCLPVRPPGSTGGCGLFGRVALVVRHGLPRGRCSAMDAAWWVRARVGWSAHACLAGFMGSAGGARAARPYMGARRNRRRQDDRWGSCPGCVAAWSFEAVDARRRRGRILAGAGRDTSVMICWAPRTPSLTSCRRRQVDVAVEVDRRQRVVAEPDEGVAGLAGELARHRQRCALAVSAPLHRAVQLVLGRAAAAVQLGGLEQRPPQRLRALLGELARGALAVGGIHRHAPRSAPSPRRWRSDARRRSRPATSAP